MPTPGAADGPRVPALPWWGWVLLVDGIFLAATVSPFLRRSVTPQVYGKIAVVRHWLDLGKEQNIGAWWSGALMLLAAALLYEEAGTRRGAARRPWIALALIMLGLSIDEVTSVHERVSLWWGWPPLIAVGLVGLALLLWALRELTWSQGERRTAMLLALAYLCYGSIGVQELLEHRLDWTGWVMFRLGLEEGTELAGSFLALLAATGARGRPTERRLRAVIPRPARLPHLHALLLVGFLLHSGVAVLVVPRLDDWHWRGNPATWYPAAVYGLAAAGAFWAAAGVRPCQRLAWRFLAALFLVASVGAVADLVPLLPGIERFLPRAAYYGVYASYVFLAVPVLLVAWGGRLLRLDRRGGLVLAGLALPIALVLLGGGWRVELATPGWLALVWVGGLGVARLPDA